MVVRDVSFSHSQSVQAVQTLDLSQFLDSKSQLKSRNIHSHHIPFT